MIEYSFRYRTTAKTAAKKVSHLIVWVPRAPTWPHDNIRGWAVEDSFYDPYVMFYDSDIRFSEQYAGRRDLHLVEYPDPITLVDDGGKLFAPGSSFAGAVLLQPMLDRFAEIQRVPGKAWRMREREVRL